MLIEIPEKSYRHNDDVQAAHMNESIVNEINDTKCGFQVQRMMKKPLSKCKVLPSLLDKNHSKVLEQFSTKGCVQLIDFTGNIACL